MYKGFKITDVVRKNPKELTLSFASRRGRKVRARYMAMEFGAARTDEDANPSPKIFRDINENTPSYTFRCPSGLLNATQFAQPALTLVAKARYEDMKSKGLIQHASSFAGHSLGEYSALTTLGDLMSVEEMMPIAFYRGLTMRHIIDVDSMGRTGYSMSAANPSRVGGMFSEAALRRVVDNIARESGWLLEIVNYNVRNQQYVCAGKLNALHCLSQVLEHIRLHGAGKIETIPDIVTKFVPQSAQLDSHAIELQKTATTTPLKGLDVPFHSSLLRPGVSAYREFLKQNLGKHTVQPRLLIDKWIPNITGRPFGISREHFDEVFKLTGSPVLHGILSRWSSDS